jgi:hypothetical protein
VNGTTDPPKKQRHKEDYNKKKNQLFAHGVVHWLNWVLYNWLWWRWLVVNASLVALQGTCQINQRPIVLDLLVMLIAIVVAVTILVIEVVVFLEKSRT